MGWNKTARSLITPFSIEVRQSAIHMHFTSRYYIAFLFQLLKLCKLGILCFRGRRLRIWYYFLSGGPIKVSNGPPKNFFEFKKFLALHFWLPAAPHLKNNIKIEIYDLENISPPTFKALIAGIKMVEFFEILRSSCIASCLTLVLEGYLLTKSIFLYFRTQSLGLWAVN